MSEAIEPQITTLGERGQVVIPQSIREHLGMKPKTKFVVFGQGDVIVLKRLELPDVNREWAEIFGTSDAKQAKPSEDEIAREVAEVRKTRRTRSS